MGSWNTKSIKWLSEKGYVTEIVESYCSWSHRKKDFGGYLDAIALNPSVDRPLQLLGVQITSLSNISARYKKIISPTLPNPKTKVEEENFRRNNAKRWLDCGGSIWIIGWEDDKPKNYKGKVREVLFKDGEFTFKDVKIEEEVCAHVKQPKQKRKSVMT